VTLVVTGNTISGRVFQRHGVPEIERHRLPLIRKLMGHKMADRSSNEADFLCISYI
jgi:hypothetical protein